MRRRLFERIAVLILAAMTSGNGWSQSYPAKPIRFVVPWARRRRRRHHHAPGGPQAGREHGAAIRRGQPRRRNRHHRLRARRARGARQVHAADGHHHHARDQSGHVQKTALRFDQGFRADFPGRRCAVRSARTPISARQERQGTDRVRQGPAWTLTYGSSGTGGSSHLGFELFNAMAGIRPVHVPYKGLAPATLDLLSGNITMSWESTAAATPYIRDKRLRALGIGSAKRSALMPDIPTISESGLKGFELGSWSAIFAPAATPPEIVRRLHREVVVAINDSRMRQQLAALGAEPVGSTPDELAAVLKRDLPKWTKIARQANLQPE